MLAFNNVKIAEAWFDLTSLVDLSEQEPFEGELMVHPESITHAKFIQEEEYGNTHEYEKTEERLCLLDLNRTNVSIDAYTSEYLLLFKNVHWIWSLICRP